MSQLALQSAQASATSATTSSATTTPVEATSTSAFDHHHLDRRAPSPSDTLVGDSPTVGRIIHSNPAVPSLGSLSSSGP
ncbi:binding 1, partial [Fusarium albosuccineum]